MCRQIIKQKNRALYDSSTHRKTTLEDLYFLASLGEEFKVFDHRSKEDITKDVLLSILALNDRVLTISTIRKLISCNDGNLKVRLGLMIDSKINEFIENKNKYSLIS